MKSAEAMFVFATFGCLVHGNVKASILFLSFSSFDDLFLFSLANALLLQLKIWPHMWTACRVDRHYSSKTMDIFLALPNFLDDILDLKIPNKCMYFN